MSHADISHELHIPHTTISSFLQRLDKHGSMENLPRPGRPRATSISQDQYIVDTAEANTHIPLAELRDITNTEVSISTIRRRLREEGIRKWKAAKRALLTKEHAEKRFKWAIEHQHWIRQWDHVCFSDESAIQKDSDNRQVWIFRHQNKHEKYDPKNVRGKTQAGGVSQMIWGCFARTKLSSIVFIDEIINSDVYIAILHDNLLPFIDELIADGTTDIIFQQDNARPHVSKKTHEFLMNATREHGFSVMEWPPNSPDMNPIEHLWSHIKLELHHRYPDTKTLPGCPETVKRVLKERLAEVWRDIGREVLDRLIDSMPSRVQALLDAEGWYTEY